MLSDENLTLIERHLAGELSPAEHEALEDLLASSEEAVTYLRDTQAIQRIADSAATQVAPESLHQRTVAAAQAGRRRGGGWRSAGFAMAASLVLGVALVTTYTLMDTPETNDNMAGTLVSTAARLQQQGISVDTGAKGELLVEVDRSDSWVLTLDGINAALEVAGDQPQSLVLKGVGPASHTIKIADSAAADGKVKLTLATAGRIVLEESVQIQEN